MGSRKASVLPEPVPGHDKDVLALDKALPDRIGLMFVRRVVEEFFKASLSAR